MIKTLLVCIEHTWQWAGEGPDILKKMLSQFWRVGSLIASSLDFVDSTQRRTKCDVHPELPSHILCTKVANICITVDIT